MQHVHIQLSDIIQLITQSVPIPTDPNEGITFVIQFDDDVQLQVQTHPPLPDDAFPTVTEFPEETSCAICLENMTDGVELPCKHVYHKECIHTWCERQRDCPVCRESVVVNSE